MIFQDPMILHLFHKDEMSHFSCQVIRQPLENLKDVFDLYKNASKIS